jgi:predicted MFS family arabinose efflux permease
MPTSEPESPLLIVFTLWLLVFSSASQTMIISPILPLIGEELNIPDAALGTLVSAYALMVGVFAILAGPVSDKIGRRRILLLGCGAMTVALILHQFVVGYYSFLFVRILAGSSGGILSGAAVSYIGDAFPYNRRGWATGWVMSGSAFGQVFGIPLGIVMADRWGFRSPFWIFTGTMALTVLLLFFGVPQPDVKRTQHHLTVRKAAGDYFTMLKRGDIAAGALAFFFVYLGWSIFFVYLPTWLEHDLGATGDEIAVMFLLGGVANVLAGPRAGDISDKIGRKGIILLASVGLSLVMVLTVPLVRSLSVAYVFFVLTMILIAMRISPFSALLTGLVQDERRGSMMSLTVALAQVGLALGGAIAGPLFAGPGYVSNGILGAVFVLAMGLIVWFFIPEPQAA